MSWHMVLRPVVTKNSIVRLFWCFDIIGKEGCFYTFHFRYCWALLVCLTCSLLAFSHDFVYN